MLKIEDIEWHDQLLSELIIDRKNPGENDSVVLQLIIENQKRTLSFNAVYYAEFKMNFGVIASESIYYAEINYNDPKILEVKSKWSRIGIELDNLFCFEMNTNSTNSTIKIFALSYFLV